MLIILSNYLYLFGAIKLPQQKINEKVRLNNIEGVVFTIPYKDIAMVVTRVADEVLPSRENMLAHEKIISRLLNSYTVIPFSFGNIFRTKEDVIRILEVLYDQFQLLLPALENKIEVGLKLFGKEEWLDKKVKSVAKMVELNNKLKLKSEDESLFERVKLGEMAKSFYISLQNELKESIIEPLSALAEATKINDSLSERMIVNAAFLINRNEEKQFDAKVNELYQQWHNALEFKYTGPWAPYNFISIKLKIEG